jgi:hypothetical protein
MVEQKVNEIMGKKQHFSCFLPIIVAVLWRCALVLPSTTVVFMLLPTI